VDWQRREGQRDGGVADPQSAQGAAEGGCLFQALPRIGAMRTLALFVSVGAAVLAAGCGGQSERSQIQALHTRVQSDDCAAYNELQDRSQKGSKLASTYLGVVLQTGLASKCFHPAVMALRAYNGAVKDIPEAAFNAALLAAQICATRRPELRARLAAWRAARRDEVLAHREVGP
jgi:hypothetical protein